MEIADIFVVNKADHPGVEQVEREIQGMLGLANRHDPWTPPIVRTVATEGKGIPELLAAIRKFQTAGGKRRGLEAAASQYTIDHLGVAVKSIDEALRFYESLLGMQVSQRETVEQEKVNVAMLPLGGPRLELLEASDPSSVIAKFIEKRGEGLHHVALKVPDLGAAVEKLKAAGARLLNEPRPGAGGHTYVFVHPSSTGGVLLELIQE